MRVVSLLASATEIVCAQHAGEMLVGRSHECDNPSWVRSLPACSAPAFDVSASSAEIDAEVRRRLRSGELLYHVHADLIHALRPDLLLTQAHCEVCAVTPADVARSGAGAPAARQLALSAASLQEILDSILQISKELDLDGQGELLVRSERQRMAAVRDRTARFRRPTVVALEWTDPLFAMANWGPELIEIANGEPLLGRKGEYSAPLPCERLREADPEFLIVAPCGFNLERTLQERAVLERYPWWPELRAVRTGKVAFADGNLFFNRSGMTVSQTAGIIAEILHGVPDGTVAEGVHWRWMGSPFARRENGGRETIGFPA
jgi:iron complex transport system substrate-binding protein